MPAKAGQPLKVFAVCLPFVYAKAPGGELTSVDIRRSQLVRMHRRAAKLVRKDLQAKAKPESGAAL